MKLFAECDSSAACCCVWSSSAYLLDGLLLRHYLRDALGACCQERLQHGSPQGQGLRWQLPLTAGQRRAATGTLLGPQRDHWQHVAVADLHHTHMPVCLPFPGNTKVAIYDLSWGHRIRNPGEGNRRPFIPSECGIRVSWENLAAFHWQRVEILCLTAREQVQRGCSISQTGYGPQYYKPEEPCLYHVLVRVVNEDLHAIYWILTSVTFWGRICDIILPETTPHTSTTFKQSNILQQPPED